MISKKILETTNIKPFHETFPYGLEWYTKEGKKNLQHFAYFPYNDYRNDYAKKLKGSGADKIRKFKTPERTN